MPIVNSTSNKTYVGTGLLGYNNNLDPFLKLPNFPSTLASLRPRKSSYSPTTLGSTQKIYDGSQEDISQIALWAGKNFYSYSIEENANQVFSITITVPYDEITNIDTVNPETIQWEITPNVTSKNIFDAGIYYVQPNGVLSAKRYTVPPVVQVAISTAVKNNGTINLTQAGPRYAPLANISEQFFAYIKAGVTSIKAYTITVRRMAVFSVQNPKAYDNYPLINTISEASTINPIISDRDLINIFEMDVSTASNLIPSYSKYKTSKALGDPVDLVAQAGYLVYRPQQTFLTPTKIQVTQLFEFDEWLDGLYPRFSNINDFPLVANTPYPPEFI